MQTWIIGIGGSEIDNVITYRVKADSKTIKKHLMVLVKEDKENDDAWAHGTNNVREIQTRADGYYAYNCFSDYHIDYTARLEQTPYLLYENGKIMERPVTEVK